MLDGTTGRLFLSFDRNIHRIYRSDVSNYIGKPAGGALVCQEITRLRLNNSDKNAGQMRLLYDSSTERLTIAYLADWRTGRIARYDKPVQAMALPLVASAEHYLDGMVRPIVWLPLSDKAVERTDAPMTITPEGVLTSLPRSAVSADGSIVLPASVRAIAPSALWGRGGIVSLSGASVRIVGEKALYGCANLQRLSLPQLDSLGRNALVQCRALRSVEIGVRAPRQGFATLGGVTIDTEKPEPLPDYLRAEGRRIVGVVPSRILSIPYTGVVIPTYYTITVVAKPDAGYKISALKVNDEDILATRQFVVKTTSIVSATFVVDTALDGVEGISLRVYPNPASEHLFISGVTPASQIRLVNLAGVSVLVTEADASGNAQLTLSGVPSGSYLLISGTTTTKIQVR